MITLKCKVRWRSDTATLLRFGEDEIWFSNCHLNDNGDGTVTMPRDLAKRKGVESYEA